MLPILRLLGLRARLISILSSRKVNPYPTGQRISTFENLENLTRHPPAGRAAHFAPAGAVRVSHRRHRFSNHNGLRATHFGPPKLAAPRCRCRCRCNKFAPGPTSASASSGCWAAVGVENGSPVWGAFESAGPDAPSVWSGWFLTPGVSSFRRGGSVQGAARAVGKGPVGRWAQRGQ